MAIYSKLSLLFRNNKTKPKDKRNLGSNICDSYLEGCNCSHSMDKNNVYPECNRV